MKLKFLYLYSLTIFIVCYSILGMSLVFTMPEDNDDVIGYTQTMTVKRGDRITDIARKYHVGFLELLEANPHINFNYLRVGEILIIPTKYVLPDAPREDIVINLAELRLYYFPSNRSVVITYPIGIGREGDETPVIQTSIVEKNIKPTWFPTKDIREKELLRGIVLPDFIPPGPLNPLGDYSMRLGIRNYLIHGTNDPAGVGLRISGGCIRMYPEDIEQIFSMADIGTKVNIVNQPIKLGWKNDKLYAEAHVPMKLKYKRADRTLKPMAEILMDKVKNLKVEIDWNKATSIAKNQRGIPEVVGRLVYK